MFWIGKNTSAGQIEKKLNQSELLFYAVTVVIVCGLGTHFVFLNYPFAMDEYYSDFQAAIFAQGKVFAPITSEFTPLAKASTPLMMIYNTVAQTWTSNYLPVYALLRTPFWMAGCAWLLNPLLSGLTLLATAGVVRRIWPTNPTLVWVGVILMATNVQFLITGMTAYAMSAHLLANLVWLWLYLDPSPKRQILAPLLGILAVGLHQPNVHLVFALPFCVKLLLDKRWKMAVWHGIIYGVGIWLWIQFMDYKSPPAIATDTKPVLSTMEFVAKIFFTKLPNTTQLFDLVVGWAKVLAWSSFALIFLITIALSQWKKLTSIHLCLLASLILVSIISFLFPLNQGHGWGNRYLFPYLGNITLLALAGFQELGAKVSSIKMVLICSFLNLLVTLPARTWEGRNEVKPFAVASKMIKALPQKVVIIDTKSIWYGQDLVRNDPELTNTPKLIFMSRYTDEVKAFCDLHQPYGRVGFNHLERFGIRPRFISPPKTPTN